MKAAIYRTFKGEISIEEVADPLLQDDGVILEVLASGLCLSDWHGWRGNDPDIKLPHVPGHELVGRIVAVGKNINSFKKGDRVTLPFVGGCGHCVTCQEGNPQVCPDQFQPGFTHWGSFAEYVFIDYAQQNLVPLPEEISDVAGVSLGCRFATSYRGIVHQGKIQPEEWLVVFGCGGVGLSAIMIAIHIGARIIAVDLKNDALEKAKKLGAEYVINSSQETDVAKNILGITSGGAHLTLDGIGNQQVVIEAINALRPRGRHVQVGLLHSSNGLSAVPLSRVIAKELEIYGSHGMPAIDYNEMIPHIQSGSIRPELLVQSTISLEEVPEYLSSMHLSKEEGIKVITSF